jgi:F0F1-type ATP synthase membrane subunit c/vacuolar-type H+-ATPase subunit K
MFFQFRFLKLIYIIVLSILLTALYIPKASAQSDQNGADSMNQASMGIAQMVDTKVQNIKDGSIVSTSQHEAILSVIPYDSEVLGVVSRDAAIAINTGNDQDGIPVISTGEVYVLVSTQQGNINSGDLITTSTLPGIGVKALKTGYVLGTAMESYSSPSPKQYGLIAVNLNLHYFNSKSSFPGTLTDIFKFALLPTTDSPAAIYKYIVAALVSLSSFVLAFMSFGRTAAKGVEALGRNPAASKIIHLGILFNVLIVIAMAAGGLAVAFLILRI